MLKKRVEGAMAAAAVVVLAVFIALNSAGGETKNAAFSDCITITDLTENSGTKKLTVDIQIPVISGLEDEIFEEDLNKKIKTQVYTARIAAEKAADELWLQAQEEDFEPWPYIFYAEYEVKSAEVVISLRVTTFLYTGGPGMPQTIYYNVDLKKNELINLSDLFINEDYKQAINSVILNDMDKDIERYVPPDEFPGVSKHTKFFIREGKLYIAFAKYEVASGMTGEPEFLIPTKEIRGILKEEYTDIFKQAE